MIGFICGAIVGIMVSKYYWYRVEKQEWDFILEPLTRKPSAAEYYYAMKEYL